MDKAEALRIFDQDMTDFFAALYAPQEKRLVLGDGDPNARLALVGEAPGEQEALLGRPFVGKAGKNLDAFLDRMQLSRPEIYVTNVVKFRPTKQSEKGRVSNRPPTREERDLWTPWLLRELKLLAPAVIVTLGNVPLQALAGKSALVGAWHGRYLPDTVGESKVFCLYHPAAIIYNQSLKAVYEADVDALRQSLTVGGGKNAKADS